MVNLKLFKSRTFWTIVALFLVNGVTGIRDIIAESHPASLPALDAVLSLAAIYFRAKPKQQL